MSAALFCLAQHWRGMKMKKFVKVLRDQKGATAIEYGLIATLIAIAAITAMSSVGDKLTSTFNNVATNLKAT
jgi:pilus assembly protein Flp/PilA